HQRPRPRPLWHEFHGPGRAGRRADPGRSGPRRHRLVDPCVPGPAQRVPRAYRLHLMPAMTRAIDDPVESATAAGLHYVTDEGPGIRRKRAGTGFSYLGVDGRPIRDRRVVNRIKAIVIPPAWTNVWICPDPQGHIQATGRHARFEGATVRFEFTGKSGREHRVELSDRRLARIVKKCQDIPGQELFQYLDDDGQRHAIGSADVNDYLREISGGDFTAKDFRT